ncbi:MAG: GNAT family N-acetyltransferase [Anaerolineae bacterium]|nr:GNAT family N-acetyltransferase [Anaerolineae bacterium]
MTPHFNFSTFPILETPRLLLRELLPSDAEAIFRIRGDHQVTQYNTGRPYESVEQASDLLDAISAAYDDKAEVRWGITLKQSDGQVIGMCGYNYWQRVDQRASVGYDLARAAWGQGIMTEALRAVVWFGFERMELHRVEADAEARNTASLRVLEKVGFRREGVQRDYFYAGGAFHDLVLFGLLRHEFIA